MLFQSMAHRAWHAYYCLPRDKNGRPPSYRSLEDAQKLSNAAVQKLVNNKLRRPGFEVLVKIAAALKTTPEWLQTGHGETPVSAWPVPPFPHHESPGLSVKDKAAFDRDAKKLEQGGLVRRAKSARK